MPFADKNKNKIQRLPLRPENTGTFQNLPGDAKKPGKMQNLPYTPELDPFAPAHISEQNSMARQALKTTPSPWNFSPEASPPPTAQPAAPTGQTDWSPPGSGTRPELGTASNALNAQYARTTAPAFIDTTGMNNNDRLHAQGQNRLMAFQAKLDAQLRGQDMGHVDKMTGNKNTMSMHGDDHGLRKQMYELTGKMHDENLGFKQGQHDDNYAHARAQLNQQGTQFDKNFGHQQKRDEVGDQQWGQTFDRQGEQWSKEYGIKRGQAELGGAKWVTNPETGQLEMVQTPGIQFDESGMPVDNAGGAAGMLDEYFARQQEQQAQQGSSTSSVTPAAEQRQPLPPPRPIPGGPGGQLVGPAVSGGSNWQMPGTQEQQARQMLNAPPPMATAPAGPPSVQVRPWVKDWLERSKNRASSAPNKPGM